MDFFFPLGFYEICAGIPAHHISSFDGSPLSSADPSECFIQTDLEQNWIHEDCIVAVCWGQVDFGRLFMTLN